ncbi:dTDP-4-dehydrorhamnose reductase [Legionella saoudiensis]|uniref:dTDP-4-dehydrorhamnose reductase n=1 Tax=Legionella saoudiensis TaxID=1750561 RepID=UPI0007303806|nr:dTDP-4-dehydrorhamnose reductase [Legionella saoudiensis]
MRILLLGKNGQLGWELQRALSPLGELIALDRNNAAPLCGDLTKPELLARTIRHLAPDVIVNAAAYTAVDKAESEPELAMLVNATATEVLATEATALDAWLIHYSTDYVFDGSGSKFWQETDPVAPLNCYGKSKLTGEQAIQASGCKHLIFRTSWVYAARGANFAKTILRLARERQELRIINDQIGVPTGADLLADITAHTLRMVVQNPLLKGVYHLAPRGETSWYDYAKFLVDEITNAGEQLLVEQIIPISSEAYPTPAKRPLNSRLNTTKLIDAFSIYLPDWELGVSRMIKEILGK